jgi:hypothetical protein|tara:strand:- start:52 stop:354 length:303 start_codon:yes stop_codon:yes gene_type:complete
MPGIPNLGLTGGGTRMGHAFGRGLQSGMPMTNMGQALHQGLQEPVIEVDEEEDFKAKVMSRLGQGFRNPEMGDAMTAYGLQMMGPQFAQQNRGLLNSFGG